MPSQPSIHLKFSLKALSERSNDRGIESWSLPVLLSAALTLTAMTAMIQPPQGHITKVFAGTAAAVSPNPDDSTLVAFAAEVARRESKQQASASNYSQGSASFQSPAPSDENSGKAPTVHRQLLSAVQGPALSVGGSRALCDAIGAPNPLQSVARQQPATSPGSGNANRSAGEQIRLQQWYFGSNACVLEYPPPLDAVVTKATTGLAAEMATKPQRLLQVAQALDAAIELATAPATAVELSRERKLLLHSLAWEIGLPLLREGNSRSRDDLIGESCRAWNLLDATRLGADSLDSITGTLPALAEIPEIRESVLAITASSDRWLEVVPVSDSHTEALMGRFTPRILLSSPDPEELVRIREYLTSEGTRYSLMGRLPLLFDKLDGVLLLYFNALDQDQKVIPTDLLAFWQQFSYSGRMDLRYPDLPQAEEKLEFRTVRYVLDLDHLEADYELVDQKAMAHKSFVEAMPPQTGSPVTVQRGVCLKCHTKVVETFHPMAEREVRFTRPFEYGAVDILPAFIHETIETELAEWQKTCDRP